MAFIALLFCVAVAAAFFGVLYPVIRADVAAGLRLDREPQRTEPPFRRAPDRVGEGGR